jgi:hypothetical protein
LTLRSITRAADSVPFITRFLPGVPCPRDQIPSRSRLFETTISAVKSGAKAELCGDDSGSVT